MEIDLNKILVDIIKLDKNLQDSIKRKVEDKIINELSDKFLEDYYTTNWMSDKKKFDTNISDKIHRKWDEKIEKY